MAQLFISLLGPLQVTLDGEPVTDFATDKARALLAYLVVEADHPHRRETLSGLLWPDQPERKARQNLRQALSHLRQALGDQDESDIVQPFLLVSREAVQFNSQSSCWLDIAVLIGLLEACDEHRHRRPGTCLHCLRRMEQVAELYRGDFLEQFSLGDSSAFEEWASLKREWLHRRAVEALSCLTDYYERRGEYGRARQYVWRQVELDPWREEAHRQLMRLLALDGQRSAALAQYETCRQALVEELNVEPIAKTVALYERIRGEQAPTETRFGRFAHKKNLVSLPNPPTSFVGREEELAELAELLADPDCRLVTLVGPGGIGKSRLALQAAADQVGAFAHGVYFVPLASTSLTQFVTTPVLEVISAIADTLKFPFYGQQDPREQLLNYLREKEMLLVLDNLEHLLPLFILPTRGGGDGGAELLAEILQHAPGVTLLVTSRERLALQEEWVYEVEGLAYPASCFLAPTLAAETYSALDLFQQRARQANRRFSLSEAEMPHVVRICQLVEGAPLGIELATAWTAARSCREIAQEIEGNLDALRTTTPLRNVPERHRSMWATFEHSWNLLSEGERLILARLSVFQGGFEKDAARQVAGASPSILMRLIHKSLLRHEEAGRYHIPQLLGQYAAEKLGRFPGQKEIAHSQHASHYAGFLQEREEALKGERQREALDEIGIEIDNVRCAWQWALAQVENRGNEALAADVVGRSMESLYLFFTIRSRYYEGEETLSQATRLLDDPDMLTSLPARTKDLLLGQLLARQGRCCEFTTHSNKATTLYERSLEIFRLLGARRETALPLNGLGYMAQIKGEYTQAEQHYQESLTIYRRIGDSWGSANALSNLCLLARRQGDFLKAKQYGQESLAIRREIGDQRGVASSLNNLGLVYCMLGEYVEAKEVLLEALQICHQLGNKVGTANALTGLCQAAFRMGEISAAERFGQESLAIYQDISDHWGVAIAFNNLGHIAMELGEYARAKRLYRESLAVYHRIEIKSGLANTLSNLGETCSKLGEYAEARQYLHQALEIAQEIGAVPITLEILIRLASLLAQNSKTAQGLELLAFALHQPELIQDTRERAAALFSELAAALPPEMVAAVKARGQARELSAVVAETLRLRKSQLSKNHASEPS